MENEYDIVYYAHTDTVEIRNFWGESREYRLSELPVVGVTETELGEQTEYLVEPDIHLYFIGGEFNAWTVDLKPLHEKWVNIYNGDGGLHTGNDMYETEEEAVYYAKKENYVASAKVSWRDK